MKCRKKKCRDVGGVGVNTSESCLGMPVYQCSKCGRKFAVGVIPRKKTTKRISHVCDRHELTPNA